MKKQTEGDLVAEMVTYIKLHFARPLKLTRAVRHIGYPPAYLGGKFRAERSYTSTYRPDQIRIKQSRPLLLDPALTVGDMSYLMGLCEQSHFVRVLHRYVGVTPRQHQQSEERDLPL